MAIPGDTDCHEIAPCGSDEYGSIPVEATTQFVNGAYAGTDSDGSRARPWRHVQQGIDHARSGAIVAVAAGRYAEDLLVQDRPVRLWGRCPALVEVVGSGTYSTLEISSHGSASGAEVHQLSITGPGGGILVIGSSDVIVDRVWVHDTGGRGIGVQSASTPTSIAVNASLVEATSGAGVFVGGSQATIESTVVRDTQPRRSDDSGVGVVLVQDPTTHERAAVTIRTSLLDRNHVGALVSGSDARIESTVVRGLRPATDGPVSAGVLVTEADVPTNGRASLLLRTSLLERNDMHGVVAFGSDATIETTVVRGTQPLTDGTFGRGVSIRDRGSLTLRASLLEQNHEAGVHVVGSDATIEATVVRATQPAREGGPGRGIDVDEHATTHEPATLRLRSSLLEQNHEVGVHVVGSDATIEATVVRATQPGGAGKRGSGVVVRDTPTAKERATLALRSSLLEQNHENGALIVGAQATIESTIVRGTQANGEGEAGRGVMVGLNEATNARGSLTLRTSLLEQNHEVGVGVLGSDATIEATVVRATQPPGAWTDGIGVVVEPMPDSGERGSLMLHTSLLEQNEGGGVVVISSDAAIEGTVVRATGLNRDGQFGRGIEIQEDPETHERATLSLRASAVEQNHESGVFVAGSDATIEATVVRGTQPTRDGDPGDGITVDSGGNPVTVAITSTTVESNTRAGVASFGAAVVLVSSTVRCNRLDLNGRASLDGHQPFTFAGSRDNVCGCDHPVSPCPVETATLSPPERYPAIPPAPEWATPSRDGGRAPRP
ncbi:hypothetical protein BE08_35950 [Sorangium cellulosum]|uniref:Right handed beta helix domain-containing protein n=1 Tax=Sorangium cellulosum TaxID=56 RepID=A0A150PCA6_SORCE|nr:hypothetical protein BE08_35950 [Sorangium cellulosum]